jgi:hypothetical protein
VLKWMANLHILVNQQLLTSQPQRGIRLKGQLLLRLGLYLRKLSFFFFAFSRFELNHNIKGY